MAGAAGFEPATPGFGDRCSSQLSYAPMPLIIAKKSYFACWLGRLFL